MFGRQANGRRRVSYVDLGLMEGDIIVAVLDDLKREVWKEKAQVVEDLMKERTDRWKQEAYPFGSEMAWDSTGQEEVYAWCKYFGHTDKALVALNRSSATCRHCRTGVTTATRGVTGTSSTAER